MPVKQSGFTLIELMVVIAVLGILATLAVMAYQDYSVRAKVAEAISLSEGVKPTIADFYQTNQRFPNSMNDAGVSNLNTKWVSELSIIDTGSTGIIAVHVDELATGLRNISSEDMWILLEATPVQGALDWDCRVATQPDGTTVDATITRLAPAPCRD